MRFYLLFFACALLVGLGVLLQDTGPGTGKEQTRDVTTANAFNEITPAAGKGDVDIAPISKGPDLSDPKEEIAEENFGYMSDQTLNEVQDVYENCMGNRKLSTYYDCECRSLKYLDARIEKGNQISRTEIIRSLSTQCPNMENIAGKSYGTCLSRGKTGANGQPMEEYCACVGNTFAEMYSAAKVAPETNAFYNLKTTVLIKCNKF